MKDKISVIVPVYKVEKYLEKCVDSILNQTYSNIEVILIDDGSPDNCGKMCDTYAEKDSRVLVIHKENGGVSEARNEGMKAATGEYVSFVDSDDWLDSHMFEILYNRMQKEESDMSICNFLYVDEEGQPIVKENLNKPIKDELLTGEDAFGRLVGEKYWYYITLVNRLYRKIVLENIVFPNGKIHEDENVSHYILVKCKRISCVERPLYNYVQRDQSIMHSGYTIKNMDRIDALCSRVECAKKLNKVVMEKSLEQAAIYLLMGYRKFGNEDNNKHILREKRRLYNKAYKKAIIGGLHIGVAIKCGIVFLHPRIYIGLAKMFKVNRDELDK